MNPGCETECRIVDEDGTRAALTAMVVAALVTAQLVASHALDLLPECAGVCHRVGNVFRISSHRRRHAIPARYEPGTVGRLWLLVGCQ